MCLYTGPQVHDELQVYAGPLVCPGLRVYRGGGLQEYARRKVRVCSQQVHTELQVHARLQVSDSQCVGRRCGLGCRCGYVAADAC